MAQALLLRRGGAKAGLAVLAVSSAAGLPASAQDNTVAVVTALAVGTATASASAPDAPQNGDLWLLLGSQSMSPFTLPGAKSVVLHPRAAYQRVADAWAVVTAYVRLGGAWQPLSLAIFDQGVDVLASLQPTNSGYNYPSTTVARSGQDILATRTATSGRMVWTLTALDLSNISAIKCLATLSGTQYTADLAVALTRYSPGNAYPNNAMYAAYTDLAMNATATATLNVSALNGFYYVGFALHGVSGAYERIHKVWMER